MKKYLFTYLFILLSVSAVAQRSTIQGGDGLLTRRDSVLQFRIDATTIKRMGDSLGYGAKETISFTCRGAFTAVDTARSVYLSPWHSVSPAAYGIMAVAHATGDWTPIRIAITHEYDSGYVKYEKRDTIVYNVFGVPIPRGSIMYVAYTPAQSYGGTDPQSLTAAQEINIWARPQNGSTVDYYSAGVKVPQILGWAGRQFGMGLGDDHWLTVTVTLAQE